MLTNLNTTYYINIYKYTEMNYQHELTVFSAVDAKYF